MTISLDMVMEGCYTHDKLQELWKQIGSLHLSYLEKEEGLEKLNQRDKLEDCIKQFLCLAPHNQKFMYAETANVLHRSASCKKDFSAYRAATAWNAIAMYAANLLNQPWRKEYREIKMYSGFYKHQIDANLVGAEIMFEAMGYKHAGDSILILEGPICPDQVISISQDSLVAYVECQILKSIWEEVCTSFKVSWLEVLEFRETHLCSPQQSVQAINYRIHERQYQQHARSYSQGTDPFLGNSRCGSNLHYSAPSLPHANHSFPPLVTHPPVQSQCIYANYGNCTSCAPILPPPCGYMNYTTNMKPNYCCANGFTPPYPYNNTAGLIDVNYDAVDGPSSPRTRVDVVRKETSNSKITCDNEQSTSDVENWDYVYRNLESQGYSKDLGERGDLLKNSKKTKSVKETGKKKSLESFSNLSIRERPKQKDKSESSTVIETKSVPKVSMNGSINENLKSDPSHSKHKESEKKVKEVLANASNKWECTTCTYLNDPSRDVCEMCHKSKIKIQDMMEIGGSQCPKCTLVNPRSNKLCAACGDSLKNSPTYI